MQIAKTYTVPTDVSLRDTRLIDNNSNARSFSTVMQRIIDDKTILAPEIANQKQSDSSCNCDSSIKKCKCDSGKETEESPEAKKTGIAACMDCSVRKSGQCAMWNGKDGDSLFNLLSATSNNSAPPADVAKILDVQTHLDEIAKASSDYDYTNAYTYLRRKIKNVGIE